MRDNILDGGKEGRAGEVVECERGCLNKRESQITYMASGAPKTFSI